jgi:hypothetical protein
MRLEQKCTNVQTSYTVNAEISFAGIFAFKAFFFWEYPFRCMPNFPPTQLGREAGSVDLRGTHCAGAFSREKFYACVPVHTMGEIHIIVQSPSGTHCVSVGESLSGDHVKGTVGQEQCV